MFKSFVASLLLASACVLSASPVITIHPQSRTCVTGQPAVLYISVESSVGMSYQWYKNDVAIAGATESSFELPEVSAEDAGAYFIRVTDEESSVDSRVAVIDVITVAEVIDNEDLEISSLYEVINEFVGPHYPQYVETGDSFEGGSAYISNYYNAINDTVKNYLEAVVEGPVILNYAMLNVDGSFGDWRIYVDGDDMDLSSTLAQTGHVSVISDTATLYDYALVLPENKTYTVQFASSWDTQVSTGTFSGSAVYDNIRASKAPVLDISELGEMVKESYEYGEIEYWKFSSFSLGTPSYQLLKDGLVIDESSDGLFALYCMSNSDAGDYQVRVYDEYGEDTSEVFGTVVMSGEEGIGLRDALDVSEEDWTGMDIRFYHYHYSNDGSSASMESNSDCGEFVEDDSYVGGYGVSLTHTKWINSSDLVSTRLEYLTAVDIDVVGPCILEVGDDDYDISFPEGGDCEVFTIGDMTAVSVKEEGVVTVRVGAVAIVDSITLKGSGSAVLDWVDLQMEPLWYRGTSVIAKEAYVGGSFEITVEAVSVGDDGLYELWKSGEKVMESSDGSFYFAIVTIEDAGTYEIRFSDEYGSLDPETFSLNVVDSPDFALDIDNDANLSINNSQGWSTSLASGYDGAEALYGENSDAGSSLDLEFECLDAGYLSFWWKKTGEGNLVLSSDELSFAEYSGSGDWEQVEVYIENSNSPIEVSSDETVLKVSLEGVGQVYLDNASYYRFNYFEKWMSSYMGSLEAMHQVGNSLYLEDHDDDGIPNGMECLFDTDPVVPTISPLDYEIIEVDGERHLRVSGVMKAVVDGIYIEYQVSPDMLNWSYAYRSDHNVQSGGDTVRTISFEDDEAIADGESRFVRLVIKREE